MENTTTAKPKGYRSKRADCLTGIHQHPRGYQHLYHSLQDRWSHKRRKNTNQTRNATKPRESNTLPKRRGTQNKEVKELSPTTEVSVVKYGMGRYIARNKHPETARKIISEDVVKALKRLEKGEIVPVELPDPPYRLEMHFSDTGAADAACWMPGTQRINGRTTLFEADDIPTVYKAFYCQTRLQRTRLLHP